MLFSGVCLEVTQTDFLLKYDVENHTTSKIAPVQEKIINSASCTAEMLGLRNATNIVRVAEQFPSRWEGNASLFFVCIYNLHQSRHNFLITVNIPKFPELYPEAMVLNYIHNKDGKK